MTEPAVVRPLDDHRSLRERIAARLRQAIITGDLPPKTRLVEPELARQLNVSRTPLREAIRQLEAEGFVVTVPRGGAFVRETTPRDVEDLYPIRAVIEGLAARQAAGNPDPAKRELLQGILAELAHLTADSRQYHEVSGRFHDAIVELSGNRQLRAIYQGLTQHVARMRTLTLAARGRPGVSLQEHRRIVAAILRGRGAEAERAMREHIEGAHGVLRERVQRSAGSPARKRGDQGES
ncbi:MAG: GntR family transcriptional regulator [candidate division NC10 bacterium]|nr:GntR family transcriptional regulator [candidate division NC10 bacterium]